MCKILGSDWVKKKVWCGSAKEERANLFLLRDCKHYTCIVHMTSTSERRSRSTLGIEVFDKPKNQGISINYSLKYFSIESTYIRTLFGAGHIRASNLIFVLKPNKVIKGWLGLQEN